MSAAPSSNPADRRTVAILDCLVRHGYPLHVDVLARMLEDKHRGLFKGRSDLVLSLTRRSDLFANLGHGVFGLGRGLSGQHEPLREPKVMRWPDAATAILLGALCARGRLETQQPQAVVTFRYGGKAYSHKGRRGYIGKGSVSFRAVDVVPLVPKTLGRVISPAIGKGSTAVTVSSSAAYELLLDFAPEPARIDEIRRILGPGIDYQTFVIPLLVFEAADPIKRAFLRGFGLASGLVSSGTNLYGNQEQVWLRPDTSNKVLFHQVIALLRELGIDVYWNDRDQRDISVKINCEDWATIGFGVDWLDAIVAEGARLNGVSGHRRRRRDEQTLPLQLGDLPSPTPAEADEIAGHDRIRVGSVVTVIQDGDEEIWELVAATRANPAVGRLSIDSPMGNALRGHRVGDSVSVRAPGGTFELQIRDVAN
jgi:Transcription elongation factor, GreA/GreB, C-term